MASNYYVNDVDLENLAAPKPTESDYLKITGTDLNFSPITNRLTVVASQTVGFGNIIIPQYTDSQVDYYVHNRANPPYSIQSSYSDWDDANKLHLTPNSIGYTNNTTASAINKYYMYIINDDYYIFYTKKDPVQTITRDDIGYIQIDGSKNCAFIIVGGGGAGGYGIYDINDPSCGGGGGGGGGCIIGYLNKDYIPSYRTGSIDTSLNDFKDNIIYKCYGTFDYNWVNSCIGITVGFGGTPTSTAGSRSYSGGSTILTYIDEYGTSTQMCYAGGGEGGKNHQKNAASTATTQPGGSGGDRGVSTTFTDSTPYLYILKGEGGGDGAAGIESSSNLTSTGNAVTGVTIPQNGYKLYTFRGGTGSTSASNKDRGGGGGASLYSTGNATYGQGGYGGHGKSGGELGSAGQNGICELVFY